MNSKTEYLKLALVSKSMIPVFMKDAMKIEVMIALTFCD